MKRFCAIAFAFAVSAVMGLTLSENGATRYRIVCPDNATDGDMFVAKDLAKLLKDATGAEFPIVLRSAQPEQYRIFAGIAPEKLPEAASLEEQEHCVFTSGDDLYLFGGGINGTRYAVYDFLQNVMGFRFFDARGGMKVPSKAVWKLPELKRRIKFDFPLRRTTMYWLFNHPASLDFQFRNGQNNYIEPYYKQRGITINPDDFLHNYPLGHTIGLYLPVDNKKSTYRFVKESTIDLTKEHPDYFTMTKAGKRVFTHQVCLSNPGARKLLAERVLENMRRNPQNCSFDISANDVPGHFCYCKDCIALEEKYGSIGGPLFDFMLWFCPQAEKEFPGKLITSLIYRKEQTQRPPKNIAHFPKNFTPVFAPIDDNFAYDWGHPDNRETYEDLKTWCKITDQVWVWYYPIPYTDQLTPPFGNIERSVNDIRLMKAAGVKGMIWEHNVGVPQMTGLADLHSYVCLQLFQDAEKDWRVLYDEFIDFEYGKAAQMMKRYLEELESLRKNTKLKMVWNTSMSTYTYLTPERLVRWQEDFDKMEDLVKDDAVRLDNVGRMRCNLDFFYLSAYSNIRKNQPKKILPFDTVKERLTSRFYKSLEKHVKPVVKMRYDEYKKNLDESLLVMTVKSGEELKPLPQEIFGNIPEERLFVSIPKVNGASYKKDDDAAFGVTAVFTRFVKNQKNFLPFYADFEDVTHKSAYRQHIAGVTKETLGPRGEYKFYEMGQGTLTQDCVFRMGVSDWWDFKTALGGAYVMGELNNVTFYASLKFEGEGFYAEDQGKPNVVFCDRVVVVRNPE